MSTTRLYWAFRVLTEVQAWPSSVPAAPPKEAITSPPAERRLLMADCQPASAIEVLPLSVALQVPSLITKARVKYLSPVAVRAFASALGEFQVST